MPVTVFTMAPSAADYGYSKELESFKTDSFSRPIEWRKVEIDTEPYRIAYQCDRYRSFLGGVTVVDDPRTTSLDDCRPAPTNYKR